MYLVFCFGVLHSLKFFFEYFLKEISVEIIGEKSNIKLDPRFREFKYQSKVIFRYHLGLVNKNI